MNGSYQQSEYRRPHSSVAGGIEFGVHSNGMRDQTVKVTANRSQPVESDEDEALLKTAQDQFRRCVSWDSEWARKAKEELDFCDGLEHWDGGMKEERKGRPCLTFDRIGPAVDQVINDARQNPPEAKFSPVGAGADKDTADLIQGLDRNIDQDSGAITAYMTGYEHAVKVGRGWWRVHIEWEDDEIDCFQQKLVVKRIPNPFSVYPDPSVSEFDYSDMQFCFVTEDLDIHAFQQIYPNAAANPAYSNFESIGDKIRTEWFPVGCVRIAEYWWVEHVEEEVCQLRDGSIIAAAGVKDETQVLNRRTVRKRKVYGAKITGAEVLERWEWPGKWIPVIPVLGREIIKDGKRQLRGMIRPAMDANLMYDFLRSKEVETVGLASIVQWLVAAGSVEGFEYQWTQANRKALPFLEWKQKDENGQPYPPPQRIWPEGPLGAISAAIANSADDIRATTSTYQPSLGDAPPEASGRAINARQRESDNAHFNYHDNLYRALRHSARIKLDLMPKVYDEPRLISIVDPDGTSKLVQLNQEFFEKGVRKIYSLRSPARYDVTIGTGPSYPNQRAEAADRLTQLAPMMPALMARAPDLVIKAIDLPGNLGSEIADRVRPPDIQHEADGQVPIPIPIQQAMAQKDQIIRGLQGALAELQKVIETKKLDIESKERIAGQSNATAMVVAEMKANSDKAIQAMQLLSGQIEARLGRLHEGESLDKELAADAAQAAAQAQQQQAPPASQGGSAPMTPPSAPPALTPAA